MIPSRISKETKSPGELLLFPMFESDKATKDWLILHSLSIADHISNLEGEADFLVIAPDRGIALVEVKAVQSVGRSNGIWQLGSLPPTTRSPFEQANEAYRSVEKSLKKLGFELSGIPFDSIVWFTHISRSHHVVNTPEWNQWEALYSEDRRGSVGHAISKFLDQTAIHMKSKGRFVQPSKLDRGLASRIANALRPDFERRQSANDVRQDLSDELEQVLSEQLEALEVMEDNERVVFIGPAGSGKTHLAKAAARKHADEGKSGYLICFNKNLAKHLGNELSDVRGLHVGTFHALLKNICGIRVPSSIPHGWWDNEFLDIALEWLLSNDSALDYLVIDEAQDVLRSKYMDILDCLVRGELVNGRTLIFGDFDHQKIYTNEDVLGVYNSRIPNASMYRLQSNCRNLPKVGASVALFGRLNPGYKRFRRSDDGVQPTFKAYESVGEAEVHLIEALRELTTQGFELRDIVILSPRRKSAAAEARGPWLNKRIQPFSNMNFENVAMFTTIQAYKGLEAPCVIVTDIDQEARPADLTDLLYIGMSRSTMRTIVIGQKSTLSEILPGVA